MNTWQLLTPDYISEFFAVWYAQPFAIAILFVFLLLIFPFQLVLIKITKDADKKQGDTWNTLKRRHLLILIHKAKQTRQSKAYWICFTLVWVLGIGYFCFHYFYLHKNPDDILTTGSLQTLSRDDFEVARQFFQRWIALGWVLMLFSLAFFLNYLERGFSQLKGSTGTVSELYKPRLEIHSYQKSPSDSERLTESLIASHKTKVYLSREGGISTSGETGEQSSLLIFEYHEEGQNSHQGGWWCIKSNSTAPPVYLDGNKLEGKKPRKLIEFHLFRWSINRQTHWCKVIVR